MAPYLAFVSIGQFEIRTDTVDGQQVITAYSDRLGDFADAARSSVERTAEIVRWLFTTWLYTAGRPELDGGSSSSSAPSLTVSSRPPNDQ